MGDLHQHADEVGKLVGHVLEPGRDTTRCIETKQNLTTLTQLIEDGKVTPAIDRCYPFEQIPAAIRYQEQGHARGKVIVAV